MTEPSSTETISTKQSRIAQLAKEDPDRALYSLNHHLDLDWLREAHSRVRKDGAAGVDGQTAREYARDLEEHLESLLTRAKSGRYKAPPVRRVHIPKGRGKETRPIGVPTHEDKVLQRAVVMLLEPIYEQDFLDCSYGYRPKRSAHQALETLWQSQMDIGRNGWIVEVDISRFFDTLDHGHLRDFLRQRVRDGVLLRLIGKWLKAGVLEGGVLASPSKGTPQGGVISPLLSNIFLHYVLDEWFEAEVQPRMKGTSHLVRFADDFAIGFEREDDARKVLEVLPKRFGRYGLTLHPDKTRLVRFQPEEGKKKTRDDEGDPPTTFSFLGFTHVWHLSRKGRWVIRRRTGKERFVRALRRISSWCRLVRHDPIEEQHRRLCQKVEGHYGYYGITGNYPRLSAFKAQVERIWLKWLCRRSQRWRKDRWQWFKRLMQSYPLPKPRIVHSYV